MDMLERVLREGGIILYIMHHPWTHLVTIIPLRVDLLPTHNPHHLPIILLIPRGGQQSMALPGGPSPAGSHNTPSPQAHSEDGDNSDPHLRNNNVLKRPAVDYSSSSPHVHSLMNPGSYHPPLPPAKKAKAPKRKKKRDPNEPQKPVSAYALFFRDSQANIKAANPNAAFGDVSKIVASMWDGLDPDNKAAYKKRTENAKKEYLKKLAAYRASLVSKGSGSPINESGSTSVAGSNPSSAPPHPLIIILPHMDQERDHMPHIVTESHPTIVIRMSNGGYGHHHPVSHPPSSVLPPNSTAPSDNRSSSSPPSGPSPLDSRTHLDPTTGHLVETEGGGAPPNGSNSNNANGAHHLHQQHHPHSSSGSNSSNNRGRRPLSCARPGCNNPISSNEAWSSNSEFCSNECVVGQCRDVYSSWSGASGPPSTAPPPPPPPNGQVQTQ
nr:TOX high mobility group box family member 2-like [Lepeophtheirus salmonis]